MKYFKFSHNMGTDVVPSDLQNEIAQIIKQVRVKVERRAAPAIRDALMSGFLEKGWPSDVGVTSASKITITSVKSGIGLCLQTGNMSRMYADLLKLQKLYMDRSISAGVMVVPSQIAAKELGDNITNATRLEAELGIFAKVLTVPILLFAFDE
jgi:hypothetical protein